MEDKIKAIMLTVFNIKNLPEIINQKHIEQWDSLKHLNLVVEIENQFDIELDPDEIAKMKSLNEIVNTIQKKLNR